MKKRIYVRPSMTVAVFSTQDLVLCTSGISSTVGGGLGSYGSGTWYPFGPGDITISD